MNIEQYSIISDSSNLSYTFQSLGPKGIINKIVLYRKINAIIENFYILTLGDWDEKSSNIDDLVITDNKDTEKILFAVAHTALLFVNHFPDANILIVGSTRSRTRLYQMTIAHYINEIEKHFDVQGLRNGHLENFRPGIDFDGFMVKINKRKL
jgi:hypothetical protein